MRKIFTDSINGNRAILTGDKHNHLAFSLRVRPGSMITLCNDGNDFEAEVVSVSKTQTELKILSSTPCVSEPEINVTLFFAIMKGDKNELVAQKATELGATKLVPVYSNNCECRKESFKRDRISRIVVEAAEQCGRGIIPAIEDIVEVGELPKTFSDYDVVIFANEREKEGSLRSVGLTDLSVKNVAIVIGSEGGFTETEAQSFIEAGAKSITLGPRILRAETANIAVLSAVMYEAGQWKIK